MAEGRCSYDRPVAWTTRRPRPAELDGRDYHFIEREEFHRLIRERRFLDWDFTVGNYYGYGIETERFFERNAAILAVTARVAIRLAARSEQVCSLFLDGDDARMWARLEERGVDRPELVLRELHRSEERELAPLLAERVPGADVMSDDETEQLLVRLKQAYS